MLLPEFKTFSISILDILSGIANRRGEGHRTAEKLHESLTAAIERDDALSAEQEVERFYASIVFAKKFRRPANPSEYEAAVQLLKDMPLELYETKQRIMGAVNYSDSEDDKKRLGITRDYFESYIASKGIELRRNVITHRVEFIGWNDGDNPLYSKELEEEHFPIVLADELKELYSGVTVQAVTDYISVVAGKNEYNPILEQITDQWDKVDRWPELFEIMGISDKFEQTLIWKWFMQAVAMQFNCKKDPFGADGVLVIQGKQGGGKSEFARRIANITGNSSLFLPGAIIDPRDKDSVMQATACFITEMGELESTFNKADQGRLKAFVTLPYDTYRVPFGRNATSVLRRTTFIATVNPDDFLLDSTGERRWWVIHTDKIDLDRLDKLDKVQLWRQARSDLFTNGGVQSFRLTYEEREELNARNSRHERPLPGETELRDILMQFKKEAPTDRKFAAEETEQTASTIAEKYNIKASVVQIGKALQKIKVPYRKTGSQGRVYMFPDIIYPQTYIKPAKTSQQD